MASVSPDYAYDIFISYRHNDNRSGGVTEFVELLKTELAATIKEPLSIYFDKNPHDGLLETHHVDKSLEGKLKCLIFIPIISQTYCDPKSFAWQHEFVAFNKLAKEDVLGRDIKLRNGNVASRILPIKVHDLDAQDLALIENEIGGVLRGIEFIYREPGVNRPLKVSDKKSDNQNNTDYSNQLNKVANAIKEIIGAIKSPGQVQATAPKEISKPSVTPKKKRIGVAALILVLLAVVGYFLYPKFSSANSDNAVKSIAVLPFENMSGEDDAYFTKGVTEDILTQISKIGDLRVLSRFTLKDYDSKGKSVQEIGAELGVDYLLTGSIRREGNNLRISCQLVQVNPEKETWAENFDKQMNDVFAIQHDVATQVATYLKAKLSPEQENRISQKPTENIVAYNYYLKGREEYYKYEPVAMRKAIDYFKEALALDPEFALALAGLSDAYSQGAHEITFLPATYMDSALRIGEKAVALNPNTAETWKALGLAYNNKGKFDEAIEMYEKAVALNPSYEPALLNLGRLLGEKGRIDERVKLARQVIRVNPLYGNAHISLANMYTLLGMDKEAILCYEKGLALNPKNAGGEYNYAFYYAQRGQREKAAEHITKLAAINLNDPAILELAADIALNTDPALAKEYLLKTIHADGFDPQINYTVPLGLGYLLWQEGKIDSAKRWLDPVLKFHLRQGKDSRDWNNLLMLTSNYAVRGENQEALKCLRKLADAGYMETGNLLSDFRLAGLRKEPEFIRIVEEMQKKLDTMRLKLSAHENSEMR